MHKLNVRTIKITDYMGSPAPSEMATLESQRRRNATLADLTNLLTSRRRELAAEQQKDIPDLERISSLRAIISNLQATLKSAAR
ncbi:MAG: hypothetical protein K2I81_03110 [Alphaproteobacteria bacterium]|nr:hypothetical protein [Alphaproteobacteria bacterium]